MGLTITVGLIMLLAGTALGWQLAEGQHRRQLPLKRLGRPGWLRENGWLLLGRHSASGQDRDGRA